MHQSFKLQDCSQKTPSKLTPTTISLGTLLFFDHFPPSWFQHFYKNISYFPEIFGFKSLEENEKLIKWELKLIQRKLDVFKDYLLTAMMDLLAEVRMFFVACFCFYLSNLETLCFLIANACCISLHYCGLKCRVVMFSVLFTSVYFTSQFSYFNHLDQVF